MEIRKMTIEEIDEALKDLLAKIEEVDEEEPMSEEEAERMNQNLVELRARKAELKELANKEAEEARKVAEGAGNLVNEIIKENTMEERNFAVNSVEYRDAWLKNLMGKDLDAEERAAITATSAIPTQTLNEIVAKFEKNPILSRVDMMHFPNYVKIPVESSAAEASWTGTSTDSADALTYVELNAYQLIKTVEVPADVNAMSIGAFESYLVDRLVNKIEKALNVAVIQGDGSSKATGIATTISTATGTFTKAAATKKDLLKIMGSLSSEFQDNACWIMPAGVFYNEVMNLSDHNTFVNINDGFTYKLFGKDVVIDASATVSSTDNIFYGDLKHYRMNLAEGIKVDKDASVGFRSNSQVYRAVCLADGKLDLASAFVRYTRATA